jgi:hypothetical protein
MWDVIRGHVAVVLNVISSQCLHAKLVAAENQITYLNGNLSSS